MQSTFKLGRKFVLLAVMMIGTSFAVLTDTSSAALRPCCSECEAKYQSCIDSGGTPSECLQQSNSCFRWCDFNC